MTIDDVIYVGDWFVAHGDHDGPSRAIFETAGTAMLVGREIFDGFAAHPVRRVGSVRNEP